MCAPISCVLLHTAHQSTSAPVVCSRGRTHRLLADYEAVVDASCRAWNALTAEAGRIKSLCAYPYLAL